MRLGRDDVSALGGENARDCHFCLPEKVSRSTIGFASAARRQRQIIVIGCAQSQACARAPLRYPACQKAVGSAWPESSRFKTVRSWCGEEERWCMDTLTVITAAHLHCAIPSGLNPKK